MDYSMALDHLQKAWDENRRLENENRYLRDRLAMTSEGARLLLEGAGIVRPIEYA